MLADFHIPRLSNDMNIAVQKNHLVGQILYRSLVASKKRRHYYFLSLFGVLLTLKSSNFLSWSLLEPIEHDRQIKCM